MMLLGGQTTEFHMYEYLPFLPIASFRLSNPSLISQATSFADEDCETIIIHLEEQIVAGRKTWKILFHTVRSHFTRFKMSPVCLGVQRAMAMPSKPRVKEKVVRLKPD